MWNLADSELAVLGFNGGTPSFRRIFKGMKVSDYPTNTTRLDSSNVQVAPTMYARLRLCRPIIDAVLRQCCGAKIRKSIVQAVSIDVVCYASGVGATNYGVHRNIASRECVESISKEACLPTTRAQRIGNIGVHKSMSASGKGDVCDGRPDNPNGLATAATIIVSRHGFLTTGFGLNRVREHSSPPCLYYQILRERGI